MSQIVNSFSTLSPTNQFLFQSGIAILVIFGVSRLLQNGPTRKVLQQRQVKQTVEVGPTTPKEGEGRTRRHPRAVEKLMETYDDKIRTGYDIFQDVLKNHANSPFLGVRRREGEKVGDYEFQTYAQIAQRRDNLGSGLLQIGQFSDEPVGIYSINRPEWIISDLACQAFRFPSVALYDTLGQNAVEFVVKHAEIKTVVCAAKQIQTMLNAAKNCPILKNLIAMDPVSTEDREKAKSLGINLYTFSEVEEIGKAKPQSHIVPFPEHIYTIMYTSGTTGDPKGVILSHGNLVAEIAGLRTYIPDLFSSADIHMSYLPLAHSFERACIFIMMSYGARVGFYQGNILELFNDIATLRPTFLVGAPRVWSRLQDKVLFTVNSGSPLKKNLFHWAFAQKAKAIEEGKTTPFLDALLFNKTKARLGGRVRFILSGSAPLDPKLGQFLKVCFGCVVLEGYGLTENFAGAVVTAFDETQLGHVGAPLPCNEVKLIDIPEMNYSSKNNPPTGEILLRGANVFKGYYKDPEKTKEALENDFWFHTGDVGRWNPNGTLSIIDRKKNIFKLAQGEYVAVEYLEGIYLQCSLIQQIWVYGSSFQRYLIAFVVPDFDTSRVWAEKNKTSSDVASLCQNEAFKKAVQAELNAKAKESKLHGFEFIKSVQLVPNVFSVDNDLMTPSFKLRRVNLQKFFQKDIDRMYEAIKDEPERS